MSQVEVSKVDFFDECRKSGFSGYEGAKELNSPSDVLNVLDENRDLAFKCSGLSDSHITVEIISPDGKDLIDRIS